MLEILKKAVKHSPLAPLAAALYGLGLPAERRAAMQRNLRYDRETVEVMRRTLAPDSSCVDIGAHDGEILRHATRLAPQGQHLAFEPIPHLAARLRTAFPAVDVREAACGEQAGEAEFILVENAPAYSGLRARLYDRPDTALRKLRVQVVRLDDCLRDPVSLVKIDVEGGEYHVLLGAERTMASCRPVIVFEAGARSTGQYGVTPRQFLSLFAQRGYRLSTMARWLAAERPLTGEEFSARWKSGSDYYFIAYPLASAAPWFLS